MTRQKKTEEETLQKKMLWLQYGENSFLPVGYERGFLELVQSKHHTNCVEMSDEDRRVARKFNLSLNTISQIDFIFFWDRLLKPNGKDETGKLKKQTKRTILITGNTDVCNYFEFHLPDHSVSCFDINSLQNSQLKELEPFSEAKCGEEVENLVRDGRCLTADIFLHSLAEMKNQERAATRVQ